VLTTVSAVPRLGWYVFFEQPTAQALTPIRDQLVRPQEIRDTALLSIEGELDDISGNGQTEAAHLLCLNIPAERREHYVAPGAGHYGIFAGRRWRETICPKVRDFIRKHA